MRIIDREFFQVDAIQLSKRLLGKIITIQINSKVRKFRITEVEAYRGENDSASHAYRKKTSKNAPMFERGGIIYVYLCYGLFNLLNIVSGIEGTAEAVLIRGVDSTEGPGRVGRLLNITRELNFEDLITSEKIWLEDDGFEVDFDNIKLNKRVGIGYALQEDQDKLWRFKI